MCFFGFKKTFVIQKVFLSVLIRATLPPISKKEMEAIFVLEI